MTNFTSESIKAAHWTKEEKDLFTASMIEGHMLDKFTEEELVVILSQITYNVLVQDAVQILSNLDSFSITAIKQIDYGDHSKVPEFADVYDLTFITDEVISVYRERSSQPFILVKA